MRKKLYITTSNIIPSSDDINQKMADTLIYRKAGIEDAPKIRDFGVACLRFAFTQKIKLGPQEYYHSDQFPVDYLKTRQKNLSNPTTLTRMAIDPQTNKMVGYIEFGPKKPYFDDYDCKSEILCYFVGNQLQGKGVGYNLLANVVQQAHDSKTFVIGQENVGILTLKDNPTIETVYKRMGAVPVGEFDFDVSLLGFV